MYTGTSKQEKSCIMEFSCDMQVRNICLAKTVGNLIVQVFPGRPMVLHHKINLPLGM